MSQLRLFQRLMKLKKDAGKSYVIFLGIKAFAIPFCYLARKNKVSVDGVVAVDLQQTLPEAFSDTPIMMDINNNPFAVNQCLVLLALPVQPFEPLLKQLYGVGYNCIMPLNNDDIAEMFVALQNKNYVAEKVNATLHNNRLERIHIFDQGSKTQLLRNSLLMSGSYIDDVIQSTNVVPKNSLLIVPIETEQYRFNFNALSAQSSGRIIPIYENELTAAEHFWQLHHVFHDYFDVDNAPDFVARYESEIKYIFNSYDEVNIGILNLNNSAQVIMTCALASSKTDRCVLHLMLPTDDSTTIQNDFLFTKMPERIRLLTQAQKEFWRYFIKKYPKYVTYSGSIYDYYALRYAYDEELNLTPSAIEFTSEEQQKFDALKTELHLSEDYIVFSISRLSGWYDEVKQRLMRSKISSMRLEGIQSNFKNVSLVSRAKLLVTDNVSDRYLAMLLGIPLVLINMSSVTLDDKLTVRSEKTPMLMVPNLCLIFLGQQVRPWIWKNILNLEENIPDINARTEYQKQRNIKPIDNSAEDIEAAIREMLARTDNTFAYTNNLKPVHEKISKDLSKSKKIMPRDVYTADVSDAFVKKNVGFFGSPYMNESIFMLKNILPAKKLSALKKKKHFKIKVRLFYFSYWNIADTFCEACAQDEEIDLLIISNSVAGKEFIDPLGYNCILKEDYDLTEDQPDVFLMSCFNDPHGHRVIGDIKKYARLIVYLAHSLVPYGG